MRQRGRQRNQWRILVNRTLQLPVIGVLLLLLCIMSLGALASVYLTLWSVMRAFEITSSLANAALLTTVGLSVTLQLVFLVPFVILVGLLLTHKVAGPLVRIKGAIDQMVRGEFNVHLKLRKDDFLGELADSVDRLAATLRSRAR